MAGYVIAILLLAGGMAVTLQRLDAVARAQATKVRAEEHEVILAERLRWSGELIVATGRGYLLTEHPAMLAKLRDAEADFDERVRALRSSDMAEPGQALVVDIEHRAEAFRHLQEQLIAARKENADPAALALRFEEELLPLRRELTMSLTRFIEYQEARVQDVYADADRQGDRLRGWAYGMLAGLAFVVLGIAWYFARRLATAYRRETDALDAARRALAARDELMAIVAHDLRNPLGAITVKAAILRQGAESEKTRAQAESIENVTMRMEYLIRTMLDVAMLEAGRFSILPAAHDVEDLLRETVDMFSGLAASKQIKLTRSLSSAKIATHVDRERILQVLSNLIGNALKFTPQGGQITITIDSLDGMVHFAVADSGPGIAPEHLPHVFDRFWKHETAGKKGTGLGLFIAQGIIDAHGGRIWAESEPGRGSVFHFTLPYAEVVRRPATPPDAGAPAPPT